MSVDDNKKLTKTNNDDTEVLPGSPQPQDLGSISYKDTNTGQASQQTQSIETTATIVTETFQSEEKILPNGTQRNNKFATSFLKVGDYSMAEGF